ncbi:unnamed protein product [Coffea canephora]|uniref:Uncharacterized protein n=1 Tax=Coffea canephora TaxID=49390 RepID=A0A068U0A4_COFCA|nr:unnamed protein product [Coffea canephora]
MEMKSKLFFFNILKKNQIFARQFFTNQWRGNKKEEKKPHKESAIIQNISSVRKKHWGNQDWFCKACCRPPALRSRCPTRT